MIAAVSLVPDLDLTDDRSRYCAVYYCLVVGDLIHGSTVPMAAQFARDAMAGRPESSLAGPTVLETLNPDALFDRTENEMTTPGNIAEILAAALWSVHHGEDYRAAVLQSLCLGGESGTLASLVGGLAGIIHGEAAIPHDWRPGPGSSDYLRHRSEAFRSFLGEESCLRIAELPE